MDKSHSLSSPIVPRSLKVNKDLFHPKEDNEELLGPEVLYYSVISALMYLTNCIRLNIAFFVNLHARYSSYQLRDIGIKPIMYYDNMCLCFLKRS